MNRPPQWLKPAVHALLAMPLLWLAWSWAVLLWIDRTSLGLSAEPVAYTHNSLGLMALRCLLLSLAITPIHKLTGWTPVMALRRPIGLWAFAYAALHLGFYLAMELDFSLALLWKEALKRNFILFGLAAFLCLLPLALTSTRAAIKWLRGRRWQRLHRLAYVAGIAACVHFILRVKGFQIEPYVYLALLIVLFALRLKPNRRRANPARSLRA